jgi:hypothetical protein
MLDKRPDEITLTDLENLITTRQSEGQRLDFKLQVDYKGEGKREFLRDITSLANTRGGYLVIGVQEENAEAIALSGIDIDDPDKEVLRIDSIIRDNTEPKFFGFLTRTFKLQDGKYALVIYIPRSSNPPHRMQGDQFFARGSNGKYPLSVDQLRQVFTRGASRLERLQAFVESRVALASGPEGRGPVRFSGVNGRTIVHIIPLASLEGEVAIPVGRDLMQQVRSSLEPYGSPSGWDPGYNADGLIFQTSRQDILSSTTGNYTQLFRNGILEGGDNDMICPQKSDSQQLMIYSGLIEIQTVDWIKQSLRVLQKLEINPPHTIALSMIGVLNATIPTKWGGSHHISVVGRETLFLPNVTLEDLTGLTGESPNDANISEAIGNRLRPIFDALWQSCGYPGSPNYPSGNWIRPR